MAAFPLSTAGQCYKAFRVHKHPGVFNELDWPTWLRKYDLWDETKTHEEMHLRFKRLSSVKFGMVPEDQWGPYLRDLAELEHGLVLPGE